MGFGASGVGFGAADVGFGRSVLQIMGFGIQKCGARPPSLVQIGNVAGGSFARQRRYSVWKLLWTLSQVSQRDNDGTGQYFVN